MSRSRPPHRSFSGHFSRWLLLALALLAEPLLAQGMSLQTLAPVQSGVPTVRYFGQAIDREGTLLAVGAPGSLSFNVTTGPAGGVLLYQRQLNASMLYEQFLQAPTPALDDGYGYAVELTANQLLVGAPFTNTVGPNRGRVYAYTRVGNGYAAPQLIDPGLAVNNDASFGSALAVDGGWLAVGAPRSATSGQGGQVQLYRYDGDFEIWVYHSSIGLPTPSNGAEFGTRVLLRGDRLLVSAPGEAIATGWVYEYQRSGSGAAASWALRQRFRAAAAAASPAFFGAALALSPAADLLAVGQPRTASDGRVFLFERDSSGDWADAGSINDRPSTVTTFAYGRQLTFDGDYLYVADTAARLSGSAQRPGNVYRFRRGAAGGLDLERDHARPGLDNDGYGTALVSIGNELAIGAPGVDGVGNADEGRVYTYVGNNLNEAPALIFDNPVSVTQGKALPASTTLGVVVDFESPSMTIAVSAQSGGTSTGVAASGLSIDGDTLRGALTANCSATSGTLRFLANDGLDTGTGDLAINVLPNPLPTLSYAAVSVAFAGSATASPSTGPSDNGSVQQISVQSAGSYSGTVSVNAAGVVSLGNAGPPGNHTVTVRITDNCQGFRDVPLAVNVGPNAPPTFTPASPLLRQQGSPSGSALTIGNLSDPDTPLANLQVSVIGGGSASGIVVTSLLNTAGTVSAALAASCTATSGTVRFQVSDGNSTGSGDLQVNVSANTAPVLTYPAISVGVGSSTSQLPSSGPSDNGSVSSISVLSSGSYTGTAVVSPAGQLSLSNAQPLGSHTITIRATDNCGSNLDVPVAVTVTGNAAPEFFPAAPVSCQQGTPAGAAITIGTVTDSDDPVASLVVTRISGGTASGISVSSIVNSAGSISAQLAADCNATAGTVRFQVSDGDVTGTGDLQILVGLNTPPALGGYFDPRMVLGQSATVTPNQPLSDNGTLLPTLVAVAPGSFAGSASVDTQGVVILDNVGPVGAYTVGVQAEDNCAATTQRSFELEVVTDELLINGFEGGGNG